MAVYPADHLIQDNNEFKKIIHTAVDFVQRKKCPHDYRY